MAKYQRKGTRFSKDGRTVWVRLQVDRRDYEFARQGAEFHAPADPLGTAECQLEGSLATALMVHQQDMNWIAPPEIEALYPKPPAMSPDDPAKGQEPGDLDDEIPF